MDKSQEVIAILKQYGQEHIIKFMENLNPEEKEKLENQILKIDFHQLSELYENAQKPIEIKENKIDVINYIDKQKMSNSQKQELSDIGGNIVATGKYAVVTMAGGQGSRLEHPGPKGTFKLDVYGKGKYLFEILVDNLKEANKKYQTTIPWYIMTSKENHDETYQFLEKNNYFGYNKNYVTLFKQGELPLMSLDGKLLIGKNKLIKLASDGNGGTFASLRISGALADMKERGIKWV